MKKLILNENNGNFSVVSHVYVLYGRKHGKSAYVHCEDRNGTTYMVDDIEWKDIIALVREKISWEEFLLNIMYWYNVQEEEYCNM